MTRLLTPLALDQLQKKFATALGISESRITLKIESQDLVEVILAANLKDLKGDVVVHVQELAERLRFQVHIGPSEERDHVRISMYGTVQVCTYQEGPP